MVCYATRNASYNTLISLVDVTTVLKMTDGLENMCYSVRANHKVSKICKLRDETLSSLLKIWNQSHVAVQ